MVIKLNVNNVKMRSSIAKITLNDVTNVKTFSLVCEGSDNNKMLEGTVTFSMDKEMEDGLRDLIQGRLDRIAVKGE